MFVLQRYRKLYWNSFLFTVYSIMKPHLINDKDSSAQYWASSKTIIFTSLAFDFVSYQLPMWYELREHLQHWRQQEHQDLHEIQVFSQKNLFCLNLKMQMLLLFLHTVLTYFKIMPRMCCNRPSAHGWKNPFIERWPWKLQVRIDDWYLQRRSHNNKLLNMQWICSQRSSSGYWNYICWKICVNTEWLATIEM